MSTTPPRRGRQRRSLAWVTRPVTVVVIVAILVLGVAAGITAKLTTQGTTLPGTSACHPQRAFVPAFFYASGIWQQAADTKPVPSLYDPRHLGARGRQQPGGAFQGIVKKEQAAASRSLAIRRQPTARGRFRRSKPTSGTTRPGTGSPACSWTRSRASAPASLLPATGQLHSQDHPGTSIWINPGTYPDSSYMSVGNVVMAFEGPYAQYHNVHVPSWVFDYSPRPVRQHGLCHLGITGDQRAQPVQEPERRLCLRDQWNRRKPLQRAAELLVNRGQRHYPGLPQ